MIKFLNVLKRICHILVCLVFITVVFLVTLDLLLAGASMMKFLTH